MGGGAKFSPNDKRQENNVRAAIAVSCTVKDKHVVIIRQ